MTSNFGDLYDHITDGAVLILLIIILLLKYKKAISTIDVVLISLFYIFSLVHLGCHQKNCKTYQR
jgi:phosphatidylglycerophosphate synthase